MSTVWKSPARRPIPAILNSDFGILLDKMSSMHSHHIASPTLLALAAATIFAGVFSVNAASPDAKVLAFTPPADRLDRKWRRQESGAGRYPSKPGLYVVLTKWLPHSIGHPHFHPNDRYIYVISGTWWVGTGTSTIPTAPPRCRPASSCSLHGDGKQITTTMAQRMKK